MKKMLMVLTAVLISSFAFAEAPYNCIGNEKAWIANVKAAVGKGYGNIKKTVDDEHDPEYDVTMKDGRVLHVTCDDSGDNNCECQVVTGK